MAQLMDAQRVIETISSGMAELALYIRGADAPGPDAMRKSGNARRRAQRAQRVAHAEEMARDDKAERLPVMPLIQCLPGVSARYMEIVTASHPMLIASISAGIARGITAEDYAKLAAKCFEMIRDVNDYSAAVTTQELNMVRSQQARALYHSDARPMTATAAAASAATAAKASSNAGEPGTGVYGESISNLFDPAPDDSGLPVITPYGTPGVSAATTPVPSRPGSPSDDIDLMGF